jgi:hypothetical protein
MRNGRDKMACFLVGTILAEETRAKVVTAQVRDRHSAAASAEHRRAPQDRRTPIEDTSRRDSPEQDLLASAVPAPRHQRFRVDVERGRDRGVLLVGQHVLVVPLQCRAHGRRVDVDERDERGWVVAVGPGTGGASTGEKP